MTSIAQNQEFEQREISATLQRFYSDYRIAALLRVCRGEKQKGMSPELPCPEPQYPGGETGFHRLQQKHRNE